LLLGLLGGVVLWVLFGRLDIVAVADGKLVPSSYLKIVQPAEQGIVKEILVKEGEAVKEGQVLIRMDPALTAADVKSMQAEYHNKRIALRRIDAQMNGTRFCAGKRRPGGTLCAGRNPVPRQRACLRERPRAGAQRAREGKARLRRCAGDQVQARAGAAALPGAGERLREAGEGRLRGARIMYNDKQRERIEK